MHRPYADSASMNGLRKASGLERLEMLRLVPGAPEVIPSHFAQNVDQAIAPGPYMGLETPHSLVLGPSDDDEEARDEENRQMLAAGNRPTNISNKVRRIPPWSLG